jgi:hypothetical protein
MPGVFVLALLLRLGYLFVVDEPLLYRHQYNYWRGMLALVESDHAVQDVLRTDDWRTWNGFWTNAPLYYLFGAAVVGTFGQLVALQVAQCFLDAAAAVLVGWLGRRAAGGPWGAWAGVAYALYWPAVELPSRTMTENLHTPLLVAGVAGLLASAERRVPAAMAGGVAFGLSALTRAVGLAFLPLALVWRVAVEAPTAWRDALRRAAAPALAFAITLLAVVGPWAIRNRVFLGDPSPIETVSWFNLWTDNTFTDPVRYERQRFFLADAPTHAARRELAAFYAWRGVTTRPGEFAKKVWFNFTHFVRADGLWILLGAEQPWPAWHHAARVVLEDLMLLAAVPLFLAWLGGGRASPARSLLALWCAYYLFMVVVVFHNEIRYRSALVPFLLAGAAGGVATLRDPERRRRWTGLGLALGVFVMVVSAGRFVPMAWRAARAAWRVQPAQEAVLRGDLSAAHDWVLAAAAADPGSGRPWFRYGKWLAHAGRPADALDAYTTGEPRVSYPWIPRVVRPRLLAEAGRAREAETAVAEANAHSLESDAWLMLEVAWRELRPPVGDAVVLGHGDYGAARGFFAPTPDGRWSRGRAELRLVPVRPSARYRVTLVMSAPEPAPDAAPEVRVAVEGGAQARFRLGREPREYSLETFSPGGSGEPVVVHLRSPTWNRADQPAEQGVLVQRMTIAPAEG